MNGESQDLHTSTSENSRESEKTFYQGKGSLSTGANRGKYKEAETAGLGRQSQAWVPTQIGGGAAPYTRISRENETSVSSKSKRAEVQRRFSRICVEIVSELQNLEDADCLADGKMAPEGAGVVAEIENLLEKMFDCPFGDGESLKGVVVAIQSQTNNVDWTLETVEFLREVMRFLRSRYIVNDQTIDEVHKIVREHGLDEFRGSISAEGMKAHYRLVKVQER